MLSHFNHHYPFTHTHTHPKQTKSAQKEASQIIPFLFYSVQSVLLNSSSVVLNHSLPLPSSPFTQSLNYDDDEIMTMIRLHPTK